MASIRSFRSDHGGTQDTGFDAFARLKVKPCRFFRFRERNSAPEWPVSRDFENFILSVHAEGVQGESEEHRRRDRITRYRCRLGPWGAGSPLPEGEMIDRIEPTSRHSSEDDPGSPFESRHGCGRIGEEPKMLRRYFPLGDPFPGLRSAPWTRRLRVSMLGPHWSPERRDRDDPAASTIATMKASTAFGRPLLAACGFSAALLCATPATAQDSVERVVSLVSQGRYPEARTALEPLLKRQPNAARPRLIDGILRAREGRTAEAISIFESLRTDRPDMFEVHNNLAVLYARQGRLEAARAALLAALERRADATVHANLGDILTQLAERAYARARDLAGGFVPPPDTRLRPASPGSGKSAESSPPKTRDSARAPAFLPAKPCP